MPEIPEPTHTTIHKIYQYYEDQPQTERAYLGCSVLGGECERALWYAFRWAREPEKFSGRMLRLFETGNREEDRLITDLRMIGVKVYTVDTETSKQYGVHGLGGHLRGHLDGVCVGLVEAPAKAHVLETKTHNRKSYTALLKDGVKRSKPTHHAQMQLYMHFMDLDRALYLAQNKDDDSLYMERIHYDKAEAERLIKRAERIINATVAPPKISDDPSFYICSWCPSRGVCHEGEFARRNCRTCISATAVVDGGDTGKWYCEHWKHDLTLDDQKRGCEEHVYLPSLVPGEQIDADEATRTVTYKMRDESTWVDGGQNA